MNIIIIIIIGTYLPLNNMKNSINTLLFFLFIMETSQKFADNRALPRGLIALLYRDQIYSLALPFVIYLA